jgi:hypothetical protein
MMPMFRVRLSGVSLGIEFSCQLPAVSFQLPSLPVNSIVQSPPAPLTQLASISQLEAGS